MFFNRKGRHAISRTWFSPVTEKPRISGEYLVKVRFEGSLRPWHMVLEYNAFTKQFERLGDTSIILVAWAKIPGPNLY